jgi:hypothetical protein
MNTNYNPILSTCTTADFLRRSRFSLDNVSIKKRKFKSQIIHIQTIKKENVRGIKLKTGDGLSAGYHFGQKTWLLL